MKKIYLDFLVRKKEEKRLSYDDLFSRTNMSVSKLQRIFTGQTEPTVSDFEHIVEAGLQVDVSEVYAQIGAQEFRDSQNVDYKGAKELLQDFADEKAQIREEYEHRIKQSIQARTDTQKSFEIALKQLEERYNKNADYLSSRVMQAEAQAVNLSARAARSEEIAQAAQKRAEAAEERAGEAEKARREVEANRHQVFRLMIGIVAILTIALVLLVIANIPLLGGGNGA